MSKRIKKGGVKNKPPRRDGLSFLDDDYINELECLYWKYLSNMPVNNNSCMRVEVHKGDKVGSIAHDLGFWGHDLPSDEYYLTFRLYNVSSYEDGHITAYFNLNGRHRAQAIEPYDNLLCEFFRILCNGYRNTNIMKLPLAKIKDMY